MTSQADTSQIDVRYVADLARIELTDAEAERYGTQLGAILDYIAQLRELNVDGIEPTAHATPLVNVLRADTPGASLPRELVVANAPAVADEVYIKVPVVIEDENP